MFKISFMKNQTVTDEDINAVGYNLTNTAYTTFTNDTLCGVDELNAITSHIMNKGVKRNYKNECALTLTDNIIHIDSGLAFFENGATITVDDDGIDLILEESTETQYVYLFFNDTINVGGARCTVEYPSGDFVLLGSITNGVLKQDRTFAYLNADVKGTNEVLTLTLEPTEIIYYGSGYGDTRRHAIQYKTDINVIGYKKTLCRTPEDEIYEGADKACIMVNYDIQNNTCLFYSTYTYHANNSNRSYCFMTGTPTSDALTLAYIEDGKLIINVTDYVADWLDHKNRHLTVELYGGVAE